MARLSIIGSVFIALTATPVPVLAAGAPSQLYNKTVNVSMSVSIDAKAEDGSRSTLPRNIDRQIFISGKGRIFMRASRQAGRNATQTDVTPEKTSSAFRFEGNRMIGVMKFISGAGQMIITFASGFQSCSASVVMGHESGKSLVFKGLNGKTYTALGPASLSTPSCSIRDGNPFGD